MRFEDNLIDNLLKKRIRNNPIEKTMASEAYRNMTDTDERLLGLDNLLIRIKNELDSREWNSRSRLGRLSRLGSLVSDLGGCYTRLNDANGSERCSRLQDSIERTLQDGCLATDRRRAKYVNIIRKACIVITATAVISLSSYGAYSLYSNYSGYVTEQKSMIPMYSKKFDVVKSYMEDGNYRLADRLSEELKKELKEESILSPTRNLLAEVEAYDQKIDRALREERYRKIATGFADGYEQISEKTRDAWWWLLDHKGFIGYALMLLSAVYIFKKAF